MKIRTRNVLFLFFRISEFAKDHATEVFNGL